MIDQDLKDILLHALGNSHVGIALGWRNNYCTDENDPQCEKLVELGLMARGCLINDGRDRYYYATKAGKELCGVHE